jgi:hypothetical protein
MQRGLALKKKDYFADRLCFQRPQQERTRLIEARRDVREMGREERPITVKGG